MRKKKDPSYVVELDLRLTRLEERMEWTVETLKKMEARMWALLTGVILSILSAIVGAIV